MTWPSTVTGPLSISSRPLRQRIRVLLPEPLGPMTTTISPARISRSTPSSARRFLNDLTRSRALMIGVGGRVSGVVAIVSVFCRQGGEVGIELQLRPLEPPLAVSDLGAVGVEARAECADHVVDISGSRYAGALSALGGKGRIEGSAQRFDGKLPRTAGTIGSASRRERVWQIS